MFTDLCGPRIIGRTRSEVDALGRFVVDHFTIDWENSVDTSQRLRPTEFGYRSVHYIVALRPDVDYGVEVPADVGGLKAEVQLRTVAEHAYSDFGHDLTYKGAFPLPRAWERELAGAAATLEEVDGIFSRVEDGLRAYATNYGRYLGEEEARAEIGRLQIVLDHVPTNGGLAERSRAFAMTAVGDWPLVVTVPARRSSPTTRPGAPSRCCATWVPRSVTCTANDRPATTICVASTTSSSPARPTISMPSAPWPARGRASTMHGPATSTVARSSSIRPTRTPSGTTSSWSLSATRPCSRPWDPCCAGRSSAASVTSRSGSTSRGPTSTWGRFHLLLGDPDEALEAYASAIMTSTAAFMIETSLASLERLASALGDRPGFDWARRLLLLGLASRFESAVAIERVRRLASARGAPARVPPIVIVAGGTDPRLEEQMRGYADLLSDGFAGFTGTILSGGSTQGISGIVGDIGRSSGGRIRTVGYLPGLIPADATPDPDYDELRTTVGHGFSPLEPLQNWVDLVASGVPTAGVRSSASTAVGSRPSSTASRSRWAPRRPTRPISPRLTHLHLDHLQGLGFFRPLFAPGLDIHIWGPTSPVQSLAERIAMYLSPPLFPVPI